MIWWRGRRWPRPLDRITQGDKQQRVFVRADRAVPYGDVMEVMNLLRSAGYLKIGLVGLEGVESAAGAAVPPGAPGAVQGTVR